MLNLSYIVYMYKVFLVILQIENQIKVLEFSR